MRTLERGERVYCGSPEPTDRCEQAGYCDYHHGETPDGADPVELAARDRYGDDAITVYPRCDYEGVESI